MKIGKLILGMALLTATSSYAQDDETKRECERMLYLAQLARIERNDYKESTHYMIKAEKICGGLDKKNMDILIVSIRNAQVGLTDPGEIKAYADTLDAAYDRAEAAGMYNEVDDLVRALNHLSSSKPDNKKADKLFKRGLKAAGDAVHEGYVSYYYYNLYTLYSTAPAEDRPTLKRELINEYFSLSALASRAKMSAQTHEALLGYFNAVVRTCDDILPDLGGFLKALPADPATKKLAVNNFIKLLEEKDCVEADEYYQLIDTLVVLDPNSIETLMKKGDGLVGRKKYGDAISTYKQVLSLNPEDKLKSEVQYKIARAYYASGQYSTAYTQAMAVSGEYRSKALVVAANSVSATANSCGSSTFERKCNYLYAAQLLEQAGEGGSAASMRAKGPTSEECFDNGNPSSVTLTCYGVAVKPCN